MVAMTAAATLPTQYGDFYLQSYHWTVTDNPGLGAPILVLSQGLDNDLVLNTVSPRLPVACGD
jgi:hypothetical protein